MTRFKKRGRIAAFFLNDRLYVGDGKSVSLAEIFGLGGLLLSVLAGIVLVIQAIVLAFF